MLPRERAVSLSPDASKPRLQERGEVLQGEGALLGVEPGLDRLLADEDVDLDDAELMDDPDLSGAGLPAIQLLVPDEGGDVLFGHRTREAIHHLFPARKGGNRFCMGGGRHICSFAA